MRAAASGFAERARRLGHREQARAAGGEQRREPVREFGRRQAGLRNDLRGARRGRAMRRCGSGGRRRPQETAPGSRRRRPPPVRRRSGRPRGTRRGRPPVRGAMSSMKARTSAGRRPRDTRPRRFEVALRRSGAGLGPTATPGSIATAAGTIRLSAERPGCRRTRTGDGPAARVESLARRRQRGDLRAAPDCRRRARCAGGKLPGKPSAKREAKRASSRLARPATAFCSWITIGAPAARRRCRRARTRSRRRRARRRDGSAAARGAPARRARSSENGAPSQRADALAAQALDLDPLDQIARRRHEARLDAALGAEPDDRAPRRAARSASASAGNTCPPVPPAMIMTGARSLRAAPPAAARSCRKLRPRGGRAAACRPRRSATSMLRAAVRQERQRQALGRQQPHVHADVDEGLQADPHAEAGGDAGVQRHAGVGRERARREAAQHQHEERPSRPRARRAGRTPRPARRTRSPCALPAGRRASGCWSRAPRRTIPRGRRRSATGSSWKPLSNGSDQGSRKASMRFRR